MAKIAILIHDLFEDSEYTKPAQAFKDAGHECVHVGLEKGTTVAGKKDDIPVFIDEAVTQTRAEEYDALLIPGGFSPDKLRAHEGPAGFVKDFMDRGKPVFVICHGAQLLISADVLRGRKATCWKSIVADLKNAGAEYFDEEVVEDGNLVSSRQPSDLPAFIEAALKQLN